MAEESQTSQTVATPVQDAPVPEPNIDSLLSNIPELKEVFGEPPAQPEQPGATATEPVAPETATEVQIPEGLKPEEEKPPEPEPKKDEPDKVQKRIDELTAKRKAAEERVANLETELNDLKSKYQAPPPLAPTPANPLSDIDSEADLATRINNILEAKTWAIEHLDGGQVSDGKGGTQWLDGPAVKSILANAEMMLTKHIPVRREFLANKKVFVSEARREYPALYREGTEAYQTRLTWLKALPECANFPDIDLIIGDAIVGQKIRFDRIKARSANGKLPQNQQPLAAPAPAASPRVPQSKALSGEALAAAFAADPSRALDNFVGGLLDSAAAQRANR
jgi:hypothetical protein